MADLFLDHCVPQQLAPLLRNGGYQATTVYRQKMAAATDDEILLVAAQRGWTLVTFNARDYILLHDAWLRWTTAWGVTQEHAGILVMDQVGELAAAPEIAGLLATNPPLANNLFRWQRRSGWSVLPPPRVVAPAGLPTSP